MNKYLLISPGYPSEKNIYNNAFIHSRVKQYRAKGLKVVIFSVNKKSEGQYI